MSPRVRYLSTTLALLAVGLGYAVMQSKWWHPGPGLQARPAAAGRPALPPAIPPTARETLDRSEALALTQAQKARLEDLDRRWKQETAGLEAALHAAEQEFSRFMQEARASKGTTLQEIQRRSADVRDLSAALRERRLLHGGAVAQALTEAQRRTLGLPPSPETSGGGR
jgi:septal ring factor EnvC (AmiA/AmiB activator)